MLNFSGNLVADSGLPTYLIVIISIVVIVALLSISFIYYKFVHERRSKDRKNKNLMQEIWATEHVDINVHKSNTDNHRSASNTSNSNFTTKSGISSNEVFGNNNSDITRFDCFQYNSDFIDIGDVDEINPQHGR
jgi:Tfp pilus assembly protein PilX